jgi:cell division protein FtsZ
MNAQHANLRAGAMPAARAQIGKVAHLAGAQLPRRVVAPTPPTNRQIRVMVARPSASYSGANYGPVGGDARIKVIGVGGGGGNAVNRMISSGLQVRRNLDQASPPSVAPQMPLPPLPGH